MRLSEGLKFEYDVLFDTCVISDARSVNSIVSDIIKHKDRYQVVSKETGVPWYIISVIHFMESSGRFDKHLHNGDSLKHRTVHVPKNRPLSTPPFTWEESAIDALRFKKMDKFNSWKISEILYRLEAYNGFGYRKYHSEIVTPYLWSKSNHYISGKYTSDGVFDISSTSRQCGAAAILKGLENRGYFQSPKNQYPYVKLVRLSSPDRNIVKGVQLQLNHKLSQKEIMCDGFFGLKTCEKVKQFQYKYLCQYKYTKGVDGIVGRDTWTALFDN